MTHVAAFVLATLGALASIVQEPPPPAPVPAPAPAPAPSPSGDTPDAAEAEIAKGELVQVPGTHVRVVRLAGFAPEPASTGFTLPGSKVSVLATELNGTAYSQSVRAFVDEERLAKQGMTVVSREKVTIDGREGLLVRLTHRFDGDEYLKWIGMWGDDRTTIQVMGMCPLSQAPRWTEILRRVVLRARWDPKLPVDPLAPLDFTIEPPVGLKYAGRLQKLIVYNAEGTLPASDPEEPQWTLVPVTTATAVEDLKAFAEQRVAKTAGCVDVQVRSSGEVAIAGLKAWEITASAKSARGDTTRFVHQVVILREGGYVVCIGVGATVFEETMLPRLKSSARSFALRATPAPGAPATTDPKPVPAPTPAPAKDPAPNPAPVPK